MFAEIKAKNAALQSQIATLRQEAAALVKPMLSEFIKQNPQVKAVKWSQYTPYFNDGDACTFRVNEPYFFFEGVENNDPEEDEGYDAWSMGHEKYGPPVGVVSQQTIKACAELATELGGISDALKDLFGDHVQVIVTAGGVSVDEYDHD